MINLPESDEITIMSQKLHDLFNSGGCNPTCHCCGHLIHVGNKFKLGHVSQELAENAELLPGRSVFKIAKEHDVMLCDNNICSPEYMVIRHEREQEKFASEGRNTWGSFSNPKSGGGCSIIDGKIVP